MILELREVIHIIDKELKFAREVNSQMAMGMLKVKELITEEENKRKEFVKRLTTDDYDSHICSGEPPF